MIEKVVIKRTFEDDTAGWEDIQYWLSRPPGERMIALEELRRQFYGDKAFKFQKVCRVLKRKQTSTHPPAKRQPKRSRR